MRESRTSLRAIEPNLSKTPSITLHIQGRLFGAGFGPQQEAPSDSAGPLKPLRRLVKR